MVKVEITLEMEFPDTWHLNDILDKVKSRLYGLGILEGSKVKKVE